ncbi:hypothetical protein ACIQPR_43540 [Streptomyces sp. NPDC091280]|uniref:hypothetical protein n=1 Tax=Streptomyces sp. NPDC091280 TaxID=3365984 RepID=UPI00380857D7
MAHELLETYEVEAGNVLFTGRSAFKVNEVREPSHPLFPGLVFEGHYFDTRRGVWGPKVVLSAEHGRVWGLSLLAFPDLYLSAYLEAGDLAVVENYANGLSLWSHEVKCRVIDFGETESRVKITGASYQFIQGDEVTVPTQRLYRRKAKK